jgi:predicted dehydrogenase
MAALEAGCDVLVEKPLATTAEEALAILDAAMARGRLLMVDHHNRWNPPFVAAHDTIAAGEVGPVRFASLRLNDTVFVPTRYIAWAAQSSVLWFLGPHGVDTLRWLLDDDVAEVYAVRGEGVLTGAGVDTADFYVLTLRFRGGAIATLEHSWIVSDSAPSLFDLKCQVQGATGTIFIDTSHNRTLEIYTPETPSGWPQVPFRDTSLMPVERGRQAGFAAASIRHFIDCVATRQPPLVSGLDGLRAVEVLLAAERSAALGTPVTVELHQP